MDRDKTYRDQRIGRPDPSGSDAYDMGPEFYNQQVEKIEERIRHYLEERLSGLVLSQISEERATGRGWRRWRPEIYSMILLVLLIALTWPPSFLSADAKGVEQVQADPPNEGDVGNPASPEGSRPIELPPDPEAAWQEFVEKNSESLAEWARAVAEARGLASNEVSDTQKGNFERYAETLSNFKKGKLSKAELEFLRRGLFEYVYGRFLKRNASTPDDFLVNQMFTGYETEDVRALAEALDLPSNLSLDKPRENVLLQHLVVVGTVKSGLPES